MNVINKEYLQLEEKIQLLSEKWSNTLENEMLTTQEQRSSVVGFPVIPQLPLTVNTEHYRTFIVELLSLLKESQPALSADVEKLEKAFTDEILDQWFKEAIAVNDFYFEKFAKDQNVAEWLPFFAAEHAVRPFLQKVSTEISDVLQAADAVGGCPSCGETPRIAVINKAGKKEIACPRCLYAWEIKKIKCAHCGCEEHGKIEIIKVEKQDSSEIHVCHECNGYTKVIDARKFIRKESIQLMDIKSIHLDFIAQENGYGVSEKKGTH